ncbi:MAG: cupredoxin domain-containing protein [Tepidiformaceae bacterium]
MSRARRTARLAILLLAAVLIVIAAVGCGSEDPAPNPNVPDGAPHIDQDNLNFKPNELTVAAGVNIYFTNSETALHTVNLGSENLSGDMRKGAVFTYAFAEPGEYRVSCLYHPQMRATITVE